MEAKQPVLGGPHLNMASVCRRQANKGDFYADIDADTVSEIL